MVNAIVLLNLENAKSRLSSFFDIDQRRNLVLLMFVHVLNALDEYPVTILSKKYGLGTDGMDKTSNINTGIADIRNRIDDDFLVLPCDLPLLGKEDILKLMGNYRTLSIAPSHNGGTSGLFIPRGTDFSPQFGRDSFNRHLEEALDKSIRPRIFESTGFRDLDTIEDVDWILKNGQQSEITRYLGSLRS